MAISNEKLKDLLVRPGHIGEADFQNAQEQAEQEKKDLTQVLVDKELIKDDQLGQLVAQELNFDFINLRKEKIDEKVLHLIPELVAGSRGVIAFSRDDKAVKVGMTNPGDLETIHLIEKRAGLKVKPCYITSQDLQSSLELYKGTLKDEFHKILEQVKDTSLSRDEQDELVVKMVDVLLEYGYQNKASDIHIEPYREIIEVRFRIDGVMHKVLELPKDLHDLILTRIKILSKLRTDEHRAAQDGKLRFAPHPAPEQARYGAGAEERGSSPRLSSGPKSRNYAEDEVVDVRVSIVPIVEGENVVMRLLAAKSRQFGLVDLGFSESNLKKVEAAIKHPHGMILVTGPTGSGKTTTLYAVMKILNKPSVHISTIEDPVEYDIEGVSQIQVNPKTNLTFAKGLRAIVRQDPDIIMVGEVRDKETAGIAINSALTGHLVLSTLHTNDAATTLPRLIDMSVEPFLVASTVNVAIAQRLVRRICEKCRASITTSKDDLKYLPPDLEDKIKIKRMYKGVGCKVCGNTGYAGRTGVFEVLEMTDEIRELIMKQASSDEIAKKAREQGMKTMLEDGLEKVKNGETTLEEVLRVARE